MTSTPAMWQFDRGPICIRTGRRTSEDDWAALDAFMEGAPELVSKLPAEIAWILEQHSSEEELRSYVDGQGRCFVPRPEDGGYRGWLEEVARRAAQPR